MKKRILFEITHPKHFHQFKPLILYYSGRADVKIIARDKDVVIELLEESGLTFSVLGSHGKSIFKKILSFPANLLAYFKLIKSFHPDLIISRFSPFATLASKWFRSKTVIFPDGELSGLMYRSVIRFSDYLITPNTFREEYGNKHYRVRGLFEGSYLHPEVFQPDPSILATLGLNETDPYFLLRFVGWNAIHDQGEYGFSKSQKRDLIRYLEPFGRVLISEENTLDDEFQQYRLNTKASSIHTLLSQAAIYIGDSSTMATEAALLGTPSIRYNSFVGENDMSNFKILEYEYGLITNVSSFNQVMAELNRILGQKGSKTVSRERSRDYFSKTGDINRETVQILDSLLEA